MNMNRKKQLLEEYKNRKPEMGIISFRCTATNDTFLGISNDTRAGFNSTRAKLNFNSHPNKTLLKLWEEYGEEGFEISVFKVLKYKDPHEDHTDELNELLEQCFLDNPSARRIW